MKVQSLGWDDPLEKKMSTFQYSCLGNPIGREGWQATVHGDCKRVGCDLATKQQQQHDQFCSFLFYHLFYFISALCFPQIFSYGLLVVGGPPSLVLEEPRKKEIFIFHEEVGKSNAVVAAGNSPGGRVRTLRWRQRRLMSEVWPERENTH